MANPIRIRAVEGLKVGDSFSYTRVFSKNDTARFGDMTRDYNPVHYDRRWAQTKGYSDLICHGLLVGSMICEFGGQVGWLATGMDFKFLKPVYFGDTVHCVITLTEIREKGRAAAEAVFTNQEGQQVCRARLTGLLPLDPERELLKQMTDEGDPSNKLSDETYHD
jgi:acyl dehydratase